MNKDLEYFDNCPVGKVTTDGKEINSATDKYKGMDPPFGFNVDGNWFRDQDAYEEFLKLEEYAKLQEQARLLREELDKAPLFMFGHNCTSTETVGSISSIPDIDYNKVSPKNHIDSFNVGDLHRATHDNCGQFMIECYNNGIICQIDNIDSAFVTLVRIE